MSSHFNSEDGRKYVTFLPIILYYFKNSKSTTEMQKKICAVYGEYAMTDQMYQKWSVKFCAGDFSLDNAPWLYRPVEVDSDQIETLIENSLWYTMQEIADIYSKYPNQ